MKLIYERALGDYGYEILDKTAYDRYWWGKSPSTKKAFETWLKDPMITQIKAALMYGRTLSIFNHVTKLRRRGILRKLKMIEL